MAEGPRFQPQPLCHSAREEGARGGPVRGLEKATHPVVDCSDCSTMARVKFVQTGFVLALALGLFVCGGTIFCLVWDWYRHPDLQAVDQQRPLLARHAEPSTISSSITTQSDPFGSATP